MIDPHGAVLLFLLPLAAAVSIAVVALWRPALAHALAVTATALSAGVAWALLLQVAERGPLHYPVGGWAPPWGIELVVGPMGAFVASVISSMATLSLIWARRPVADALGPRGPAFYATAMLALCGLLGMCVTGDAFNLFVFLEVASLAGYALVGSGGGRSQVAGFRYLMLGATGASLYLIGVGYLYVATGTLNMADLASRVHGSDLAPVALAFIVAGLSLKMGLFPLHAWMPDAYACSPMPTAAFIAPIFTKVMAFALIRFLFQIFEASAPLGPIDVGDILAWMGAIAAVVGASTAAAQIGLRRLLAWSSVSQIGYIAIGIGIGSRLAVAAALLHVLNHALMKGALFYAAGAAGSRTVAGLRHLSRRKPVVAACMAVAAMSVVGIPPLGGFFSKWYLLQAAIDAGEPLLAAAVVIGSLLAIVYVFRLIEAAFLQGKGDADVATEPTPVSMIAPLVIAAIAIVVTGPLSARIMSHWLLGSVG